MGITWTSHNIDTRLWAGERSNNRYHCLLFYTTLYKLIQIVNCLDCHEKYCAITYHTSDFIRSCCDLHVLPMWHACVTHVMCDPVLFCWPNGSIWVCFHWLSKVHIVTNWCAWFVRMISIYLKKIAKVERLQSASTWHNWIHKRKKSTCLSKGNAKALGSSYIHVFNYS